MYTITTSANTHEFTLQCTLRRIPGCGCGTYTSKVNLSGCGENMAFGQRAAMRMKEKNYDWMLRRWLIFKTTMLKQR